MTTSHCSKWNFLAPSAASQRKSLWIFSNLQWLHLELETKTFSGLIWFLFALANRNEKIFFKDHLTWHLASSRCVLHFPYLPMHASYIAALFEYIFLGLCVDPLMLESARTQYFFLNLNKYWIQKCFRGRKEVETERSKVRENFLRTHGERCHAVDRFAYMASMFFLICCFRCNALHPVGSCNWVLWWCFLFFALIPWSCMRFFLEFVMISLYFLFFPMCIQAVLQSRFRLFASPTFLFQSDIHCWCFCPCGDMPIASRVCSR